MLRVTTLLVAASAALLVACGGHGSKPATTPGAGGAATSVPAAVALDDLRAVVPSNWALEDWEVSADGAYVVLMESSLQESRTWPRGGGPSTTLNVYRRQPSGALVEAARFIGHAGGQPRQPTITREPQLLSPDAAGVRRLTVHWVDTYGVTNGPGGPGDSHVTITADGAVISDVSSPAGSFPTVVSTTTGGLPEDPVRLVTRTVDPMFASTPTPTPPVTVPLGAWPTGWRLVQAASSADGQTFAVVTESPFDTLLHQLSVYQILGDALVEQWRTVNAFINLDANLAFRDINGDGQLDLVYRSTNGGNYVTAGGTFAVMMHADGSVDELQFHLPISASAPTGPIDINHDGVYEWTAVDASWEMTAFCHACSPYSEFILAWDGSAYSDASARFGDAIVAQHTDPVPPPAGAACREQDNYLSALVARYLDYWNAGRKEDAARVREQVLDYDIDSHLSGKRDVILRTIADDPHRSLASSESAVAYDCPT